MKMNRWESRLKRSKRKLRQISKQLKVRDKGLLVAVVFTMLRAFKEDDKQVCEED